VLLGGSYEAMDEQLQKLIRDTKALQQAQDRLNTMQQEYKASTTTAKPQNPKTPLVVINNVLLVL